MIIILLLLVIFITCILMQNTNIIKNSNPILFCLCKLIGLFILNFCVFIIVTEVVNRIV